MKHVVWSVRDEQFKIVVKMVLFVTKSALPNSPINENPMVDRQTCCWALISVVQVPDAHNAGVMGGVVVVR